MAHILILYIIHSFNDKYIVLYLGWTSWVWFVRGTGRFAAGNRADHCMSCIVFDSASCAALQQRATECGSNSCLALKTAVLEALAAAGRIGISISC